MPNLSDYPMDPTTALYAAVTAVEEGKVSEINLHFQKDTPEYETHLDITICKNPRPAVTPMILPNIPTDQG